jgi:crossover junction endodeoxyribonuclease RuvC
LKVLGIDPSLTSLGWGVIRSDSAKIDYVDGGLIKTSSKDNILYRLAFITSSVEELINMHKPDAVAMEETFVNKNPVSSLKLGYVRGALMASIGKAKLPYFEFLPNKVKKTVVGVGHAEKEQIKHMVNIIISGIKKDISFDEADAIAIAYTCLVNYDRRS